MKCYITTILEPIWKYNTALQIKKVFYINFNHILLFIGLDFETKAVLVLIQLLLNSERLLFGDARFDLTTVFIKNKNS